MPFLLAWKRFLYGPGTKTCCNSLKAPVVLFLPGSCMDDCIYSLRCARVTLMAESVSSKLRLMSECRLSSFAQRMCLRRRPTSTLGGVHCLSRGCLSTEVSCPLCFKKPLTDQGKQRGRGKQESTVSRQGPGEAI